MKSCARRLQDDPPLPSVLLSLYANREKQPRMNWLRNRNKITSQDLLEMLKRIDRAYRLVELNEQEPVILETDPKEHLFEVRSAKENNKFYRVDADIKTCTCPDFNYRFLKCKHIIAAEFASGTAS
jgi:SWIM zinc finger